MKEIARIGKLMSIALAIIIFVLNCQSSPAEKEIKLVLKEMSKIINEIESLQNNVSIQPELKRSKIFALIMKGDEIFEKWVVAYTNALTELPAERCQYYSDNWERLLKRFSDVLKR